MLKHLSGILLGLSLCAMATGCGDAGSTSDAATAADAVVTPTDTGPAQPLPSDPAMYAAWLGTDSYRSWRCDPSPQAALPDSPHGRHIICVNSVLDAARGATGDWPVGSAAVKITLDGAGNPGARLLDVRRNSTTGAGGWYFMMRAPDGTTPVAGMGSEMNVAMACVQCHTNGGRDFVRRVP